MRREVYEVNDDDGDTRSSQISSLNRDYLFTRGPDKVFFDQKRGQKSRGTVRLIVRQVSTQQ